MHGEYKEPGEKLVVVDVQADEGSAAVTTSVVIAGDFFAEPDQVIERLTQALVGIPVDTPMSDVRALLDGALLPGDVL